MLIHTRSLSTLPETLSPLLNPVPGWRQRHGGKQLSLCFGGTPSHSSPRTSTQACAMGRLSGYPLQADEYDGCFLGVQPLLAVVTNCEWEHVDIFPNEVPSPFLPRPCLSSHSFSCAPLSLCRLLSVPCSVALRSECAPTARCCSAQTSMPPRCCSPLTSWLANVGSVERGAVQCRLLLLVYRFQGSPSHPPGGDLRPLAGL